MNDSEINESIDPKEEKDDIGDIKKEEYSFLTEKTKIDIYQHLRLSMKNEKINCKDNNRIAQYCIPCKCSTCEKCTLKLHKKHYRVSKLDYDFSDETIEKLFKQIDSALISQPIFKDYLPVQKELSQQIEEMCKILQDKILKIKEKKIKEIEKMFNGFTKTVNTLKTKIEKCKAELKTYYNKNKKFFNLVPIMGNNLENFPSKASAGRKERKNLYYNGDDCNSLFLINYELLNLCQIKGVEILKQTKMLTGEVEKFKQMQKSYIENLISQINSLFFGDFDFGEDDDVDEIDENSPVHNFKLKFEQLNSKDFTDVTNRIGQYNRLFDSFRKTVFDSITKSGNLREIESYILGFESNKKSDVESQLFSGRAKEKVTRTRKNEYALMKMNFASKEEIILNNAILGKYFSCLTLEIYDKHFKQVAKELQSSHADLAIKKDDEEGGRDFGTALENTNYIYLYKYRDRQSIKIKIDLKVNPLGYTKFPNGCRSLLLGTKLYITGGVDEKQKYGNVLIYDCKLQRIKRIMDLMEPRAYHTMVCLDVINTLMVIGGEGSKTVEIFDPVTNRWTFLPPMSIPRANAIFEFDKPRGLMFIMFGSVGKLLKNKFTDLIEYLDLKDINKGWVKFEYVNRSEIDLKTHVNVIEINNDLSLIYGGFSSRGKQRNICVFDKEKKMMLKCDAKMLETIRDFSRLNEM